MARVAVLAGGPSSEHEVSLATSACVLQILREGGHDVRPVFIDKAGGWHPGDCHSTVAEAANLSACPVDALMQELVERDEIAFVGLHGPFGEDGTVQRLLEDAGVAYTGSGPAASNLCMDKELTKLAAHKLGARVAGHHVVSSRNAPLIRLARTVGYPCFVKPLGAGSSVGARRVDDESGLADAVSAAQVADPAGRALVEEFIPGTEVTCGVLRMNGSTRALPLVAIAPAEGFYDYHAKYVSEATRFTCPADVPAAVREQIQALTLRMFEALELRGVARLDFLVRHDDSTPVFLEANTLPGFTDHSLVPLACRTAGLPALTVVEAILADRSPSL